MHRQTSLFIPSPLPSKSGTLKISSLLLNLRDLTFESLDMHTPKVVFDWSSGSRSLHLPHSEAAHILPAAYCTSEVRPRKIEVSGLVDK
jgi:hypothetical protein